MPEPHPAQPVIEHTTSALQDESNPNALNELEETLPPYPILLPLLTDWASTPEEEQAPFLDAYAWLINHCLQQLRADLRQEEETAREIWHFLLQTLEEALNSGDKPSLCHIAMNDLLFLGFSIPEYLNEKMGLLLQQLHEQYAEKPAYTPDIVNPRLAEKELRETYAPPGAHPLEIFGLLKIQLQFLAPPMLDEILLCLLHLESDTLQEGLLHCLLHPRALVREHLLERLSHFSNPLQPHLINRLIMLRNWLPKVEAEQLDFIIRQQRKYALPAPDQTEGETRFWATAPDGAGTIAVYMSRKLAEGYEMRGALLRENTGIADCWQQFLPNEEQTDGRIRELKGGLAPSLPVDRQFFDHVIPHFLAQNIQSGQLPAPDILEWLETLGGSLWQPRPLDFIGWLRETEPELQSHEEDGAFMRPANWFEQHEEKLQWFETGADTLQCAEEVLLAEEAAPVEEGLEAILAPHREKWRNRFIFMAIRARQSTDLHREPQWQDFALLARQLNTGTPVVELPIMPLIASKTLEATVQAMQARRQVQDALEQGASEKVQAMESELHW